MISPMNFAPMPRSEPMPMPPKLASLDHLVLTVADLDATLAFYSTVLGMRPVPFDPDAAKPRWALHFGTQKINLHLKGAEIEPKSDHPTPGSGDLCFLSSAPLSDWQGHLQGQGVRVLDGPVPRTGATGPLISLYIRDPDGNLIEIATPA